MASQPQPRSGDDGTNAGGLRRFALGVLVGLVAFGSIASWYRSQHSPAGYATWSRREETPALDLVVFSWRRPDLDDITPPF